MALVFEQTVILRDGTPLLIRSLRLEDAAQAIIALRKTAGETDFLLRSPPECAMTLRQEEEYIRSMNDSPRGALLGAFIMGRLVGMANLSGVSPRVRARHRASLGLSLYAAHWGKGIGTAMLRALLSLAKDAGYEQLELEVVDKNARAIALYERFDFQTVGRIPRAIRYAPGAYADLLLMALQL